ncbi:MAG: diguanylate cyclase [Betaproteobacteria bacterium]|nr:diguanylate cyclase [Betaproteobacteria bacterium]
MPCHLLVAVLLSSVLAIPVQAAIAIGSGQQQLPLAGKLEVLEDPSRKLTREDAASPEASSRFHKLEVATDLNLGYSSSAYWLRFSVLPAQDAPRKWLLEIAYPSLDSVEVFAPDESGAYVRSEAGDHQRFGARPFQHRNLVFPLSFASGQTQTIYTRVVSDGNLTLPVTLWTPEELHRSDQRTYTLLALYYGALIALAAYNLLLYFSIRDRRYIEYVAFALSMAVGQASLNGLANQFLWPDLPVWGNAVFPAGMAATGFFGAMFTRSFLETRRIAPGLDRIILIWVVLFAICAVAPFVLPYRFAAVMVSLGGITFSAIAVAAGVLCWKRRCPGATYFLVAWTLLLLGVAVTGLRNFGWLPTTDLTSYAMQIGSALEMLLLSSALANRINDMRREKEKAQAEALGAHQEVVQTMQRTEQELEGRVSARTRELADSNARLQESQQALHQLAYHDNLTGLANRALMDDRIAQAIERARRNLSMVAILLVDLDRFKPINDSYGHAIGDEVLKSIAMRLKECVRSSDTVARIGGDEFVVVLDILRSTDHADRVGASIAASLAKPFPVGGEQIMISASVGLALYPVHGMDAQSLIKKADQAMYQAKIASREKSQAGGRSFAA